MLGQHDFFFSPSLCLWPSPSWCSWPSLCSSGLPAVFAFSQAATLKSASSTGNQPNLRMRTFNVRQKWEQVEQ